MKTEKNTGTIAFRFRQVLLYIMKEKLLGGHKSTVFFIAKRVGKDHLEY